MIPPSNNFPLEITGLEELEDGFAEIVEASLAGLVPSATPYLIHLLGVPGAGKTTLARKLQSHLSAIPQASPLFLAFDDIMASIPGYADEPDLVTAYAKYETPARMTGYALLKQALTRKVSIVFDHGGANRDHVGILAFARNELGYTTAVIHIQCELQTAKARIEKRTQFEPRHTPAHYVDERSELIGELLPAYVEVADAFFATDNSQSHIKTDEICEAIVKAIVSMQSSAAI